MFWAEVEGRLRPMLEGERDLTLALLNTATQAWVEGEYQRNRHDELGCSPLERALEGPSVVRPSPSSEELRRAFRLELTRTVRQSDATFTVSGVRFELSWRYRTLPRVTLRVARWDLSSVDLVDPRTGAHIAQILPAVGVRSPLPSSAADRGTAELRSAMPQIAIAATRCDRLGARRDRRHYQTSWSWLYQTSRSRCSYAR